MSAVLYADTLPGGTHWSMTLKRGTQLRLTDVEGGANCAMLFYNPINVLERYNAPDTLKCQHTFKLTAGNCLYSDMGRIFCSITADTFGWHDTVCGNATKALVAERWGALSYQSARNDWRQNGSDSFLVEGAKYGVGKRDMAANVNWFSKVVIDGAGNTTFDASAAKAGAYVDLRFEMDSLVLMHTCPHPLNPAIDYPRRPVRFELSCVADAAADDPCRLSRPENERGFENNRIHNACACH